MKNIFLIFLLLISSVGVVFAAPLLTDEIPQDYIIHVNKMQAEKKHAVHNSLDYESSIDVSVYTPKTISYVFTAKYQNNRFVYEVLSPKINEKMTLYIAEDVYKNEALYIKKDTEVVGSVEVMSMVYDGRAIFTEFRLGNLSTTDVNGKVVPLVGVIERSNKTGMLLTYLIKKNKKHLLYCN